MKKLLVTLLVMGIFFVSLPLADASFFFTRYQNQQVEGGGSIEWTSSIMELDWKEWSFGAEVGTGPDGYMYTVPYFNRKLPSLGKGWEVGARLEQDSLQNTSFAPSIRYAGVTEVWPKNKFLFLLQVDYFIGDQEKLEVWGNVTYLSFGQWRIGAEAFIRADRFGNRNYQFRPLRLGYRFPGFGPFKAVTPFTMFEYRWDKWTEETVESKSGFLGVVFNW